MATEEAILNIEPITPRLGAIVSGIDLAAPQPDAVMRAIQSAMSAHGVLFFCGQHLDTDRQLAFASWFGDLHVHPVERAKRTERQEIRVFENYKKSLPWHTDATFEERPAWVSVLRAVALPPLGGDTLWTSTCAAYDALSPAMQRFLEGLHAEHTTAVFSPHYDIEARTAVHPVVITPFGTRRRSLYVNSVFTRRIVELSESESAEILSFLYRHIAQPDFQVRWHWKPNSVAVWDNLATQHCVVMDYEDERVMHRATAQTPTPI